MVSVSVMSAHSSCLLVLAAVTFFVVSGEAAVQLERDETSNGGGLSQQERAPFIHDLVFVGGSVIRGFGVSELPSSTSRSSAASSGVFFTKDGGESWIDVEEILPRTTSHGQEDVALDKGSAEDRGGSGPHSPLSFIQEEKNIAGGTSSNVNVPLEQDASTKAMLEEFRLLNGISSTSTTTSGRRDTGTSSSSSRFPSAATSSAIKEPSSSQFPSASTTTTSARVEQQHHLLKKIADPLFDLNYGSGLHRLLHRKNRDQHGAHAQVRQQKKSTFLSRRGTGRGAGGGTGTGGTEADSSSRRIATVENKVEGLLHLDLHEQGESNSNTSPRVENKKQKKCEPSVAVSTVNSDHVALITARCGDGVWLSNDAGRSWSHILDGESTGEDAVIGIDSVLASQDSNKMLNNTFRILNNTFRMPHIKRVEWHPKISGRLLLLREDGALYRVVSLEKSTSRSTNNKTNTVLLPAAGSHNMIKNIKNTTTTKKISKVLVNTTSTNLADDYIFFEKLLLFLHGRANIERERGRNQFYGFQLVDLDVVDFTWGAIIDDAAHDDEDDSLNVNSLYIVKKHLRDLRGDTLASASSWIISTPYQELTSTPAPATSWWSSYFKDFSLFGSSKVGASKVSTFGGSKVPSSKVSEVEPSRPRTSTTLVATTTSPLDEDQHLEEALAAVSRRLQQMQKELQRRIAKRRREMKRQEHRIAEAAQERLIEIEREKQQSQVEQKLLVEKTNMMMNPDPVLLESPENGRDNKQVVVEQLETVSFSQNWHQDMDTPHHVAFATKEKTMFDRWLASWKPWLFSLVEDPSTSPLPIAREDDSRTENDYIDDVGNDAVLVEHGDADVDEGEGPPQDEHRGPPQGHASQQFFFGEGFELYRIDNFVTSHRIVGRGAGIYAAAKVIFKPGLLLVVGLRGDNKGWITAGNTKTSDEGLAVDADGEQEIVVTDAGTNRAVVVDDDIQMSSQPSSRPPQQNPSKYYLQKNGGDGFSSPPSSSDEEEDRQIWIRQGLELFCLDHERKEYSHSPLPAVQHSAKIWRRIEEPGNASQREPASRTTNFGHSLQQSSANVHVLAVHPSFVHLAVPSSSSTTSTSSTFDVYEIVEKKSMRLVFQGLIESPEAANGNAGLAWFPLGPGVPGGFVATRMERGRAGDEASHLRHVCLLGSPSIKAKYGKKSKLVVAMMKMEVLSPSSRQQTLQAS
ncbi:unnamed protein product [Amoebophrya sp. A25]|nr:unnamed protein product [Amoebophrya sp. A25]|eukprot:GSA25T00014741001.1